MGIVLRAVITLVRRGVAAVVGESLPSDSTQVTSAQYNQHERMCHDAVVIGAGSPSSEHGVCFAGCDNTRA